MDKDLEIQQSGKYKTAGQNRKWVVGEEKAVEEPQVGWSKESLKGKSGRYGRNINRVQIVSRWSG